VKSVAKKPALRTTAKLATRHLAVKVALKDALRAVANAPPVAKVAVNVRLVKTTQHKQTLCHLM
jgi:hypothetical protein